VFSGSSLLGHYVKNSPIYETRHIPTHRSQRHAIGNTILTAQPASRQRMRSAILPCYNIKKIQGISNCKKSAYWHLTDASFGKNVKFLAMFALAEFVFRPLICIVTTEDKVYISNKTGAKMR
jgi:hypothetical protein